MSVSTSLPTVADCLPFSIVPTVLNQTVDLMEIDSPTMQQEAPHPDPPAPTAPVRQAAKRLTAHELKLKVAGEFQCPRRVLKALPEVLWHLQLDGLVALAPKGS
jgi:hypothetical protein